MEYLLNLIFFLVLFRICEQQNLMCRQTYDDFMRKRNTSYIGKGYISYCYDNVGLSMCYENCLRSGFCGAIEHDEESLFCRFLSVFNETDTSVSERKTIIPTNDRNAVNECGSSMCDLGQFCQTLSSTEKICVDVMKTCNSTHYLVSGPHGVSDDDVSFSSSLCPSICEAFRLDSPEAWYPNSNAYGEWIQVEFKAIRTVVAIVTQARRSGDNWVSRYHLMYLCGESTHLEFIKDEANQNKIFQGNRQAAPTKITYLDHTIFTKGIRILPTGFQGRIAMRFDVLGC